jgi:hypothetical protein
MESLSEFINSDRTIYSPSLKGLSERKVQNFRKKIFGVYFMSRKYDKSVVIADVINKVSIEPLDFKTKSFKISYKDKSAVKTRDITNMMVRVFVEYDIEKKREGFENVISFLNVQIGQFEEGNTAFEDSISALKGPVWIYGQK